MPIFLARVSHPLRVATAAATLLIGALASASAAGETRDGSGDLVDELLAMWAPPPDWRQRLGWPDVSVWNGLSFRMNWFPPDTASSELLIGFWACEEAWGRPRTGPNETVQRRLLEECERSPDLLPDLCRFLSRSPEDKLRVRRILERAGEPSRQWEKDQISGYLTGVLAAPLFVTEKSSPAPAASRATARSGDSAKWIACLENGDITDFCRARDALLASPDPSAVPALRRLLARDPSDLFQREDVVRLLLACGGFEPREVVADLESYARRLATPGGRDDVFRARHDLPEEGERIPMEVLIGMELAELGPLDEETVASVLDRASSIRASWPEVSRELIRIVAPWPLPVVDRRILLDVLAGRSCASAVAEILRRRDRLPGTVPCELEALCAASGTARGIGVAMRGDPGSIEAILDGVQWEYVHLTRIGGCRVFMNNPGGPSGTRGTAYDQLVRAFLALDACPR